MRLVFALLAVVALLASPVTAIAAQVACSHAGSMAMDGMDMPMMDNGSGQQASDPCCDHSDRQTPSDKSCVKACATMCGVTAALPSHHFDVTLAVVRTSVVAAPVRSLRSHDPPRLDRPPKLLA